jgi:hypothetical protein
VLGSPVEVAGQHRHRPERSLHDHADQDDQHREQGRQRHDRLQRAQPGDLVALRRALRDHELVAALEPTALQAPGLAVDMDGLHARRGRASRT